MTFKTKKKIAYGVYYFSCLYYGIAAQFCVIKLPDIRFWVLSVPVLLLGSVVFLIFNEE